MRFFEEKSAWSNVRWVSGPLERRRIARKHVLRGMHKAKVTIAVAFPHLPSLSPSSPAPPARPTPSLPLVAVPHFPISPPALSPPFPGSV